MLSHFEDSDHSIIIKNNSIDNDRLTAIDVGISNEYIKYFDKVRTNTTIKTKNTALDDDVDGNLKTKIWVENCTSPLNNIHLDDSRVLGGLLPLGIICLVVIIGNMMVMSAVKMTHKLRGATYLFIVSLGNITLMYLT